MFRIELERSGLADIEYFRKYEQQIVIDGIEEQLTHEPDVETRNRKRMRPNPTAGWELRLGKFRVFYDVHRSSMTVKINMVGHKEGGQLLVRGKVFHL